jgi:hypothetical protein
MGFDLSEVTRQRKNAINGIGQWLSVFGGGGMSQFTYICFSQNVHVCCIDGVNHNFRQETDPTYRSSTHGQSITVGNVIVYQTLYFKLALNREIHLAEIVRAIEIARFIWTHVGQLKISPGENK